MLRKPTILIIRTRRRPRGPKPVLVLPLAVLLVVSLSAYFWWPLYRSVLEPGNNSLPGKTIVIDPGHGGTDPGAMYKGILEKDINLDVSLRVADLLKKRGAKVTLTRTSDVDFYRPGIRGTRRELKRSELDQRVRMAEEMKADIFLSIHANKDRHPSCYGMETFYHPLSDSGRIAAEAIQEELRKLQPRNRRVAKAGDYYLLRNTAMPALIVEVGFMSHWEERELLQKEDYKQKIAEAIVMGLQKYYANNSGSNNPKPDNPVGGNPLTGDPMTGNPPANSPTVITPGTNKLELYFLKQSPAGDHLALEIRPFAQTVPTLTQGKFAGSELKAKALTAVEELLKGPTQPELEPIFPAGTRLLGLEIEGSLAKLNFSKELVENFSGSLAEENDFILAIHKTLIQFPGITEVQIQVEGQREISPGGHLLLSSPFRASYLERKVKIAIVIDDLGQNAKGTAEMMALPYPITFAVMPNLENTREEARLAVQKGHQVIIHMPMAPEVGKASWLGPGAITPDLSEDEVSRRIRAAIIQLPEAVGLSNHTGSKITADRKMMKAVLRELKANNLFVLDSRTTEKTVIPDLAREMGVPWAERSVFLDNANGTENIKKQLDLLAVTALEKGEAIGIGHVGKTGPSMAKALEDRLPQMKARGIVIVPVSKLTKQ